MRRTDAGKENVQLLSCREPERSLGRRQEAGNATHLVCSLPNLEPSPHSFVLLVGQHQPT